MIILEGTLEQVESDLEAINEMARSYYSLMEYQVIDGDVVGKNLKTGDDAINCQRTITWDNIKQLKNSYYIVSLTGDPRFVEWKERLLPYKIQCTEREYE